MIVSAKTGEPNRDAMATGAWIRFDGNTWQQFNVAGNQETGMRPFKLRPKENPKEIDFLRDQKTIQMRGIYVFEKDQLKFCWGPDRDSPRPKDFKGGGKDQIRVFVLERKKKV